MSWLLTKVVSAFLLPPLSFLLMAFVGVLFWSKRPYLSKVLVISALLLLSVFSMPVVGRSLLAGLEQGQYLSPPVSEVQAQAIVVLGGGVCYDQPEFGASTACQATLARLRYAAWLYRRTGLPILVSGGDPEQRGVFEADVMRKALEEEFGVPVRWTEGASDDTRANARLSVKLLQADGVDSVLLVSQAWHLPRASRLFVAAGLRVVPAGTGSHRDTRIDVLDILPSAKGLKMSQIYFHEAIGLARDRLMDDY